MSQHRNDCLSQYQRIALASELFWIVHQDTSNILSQIDSDNSTTEETSINIKGMFASSSSPWTQVLEILENAAGLSTMDGRRSPAVNTEEKNSDATVLTATLGTDPSLRVSLSALSSNSTSRKRTTVSSRERLVLMAALRIVHAVLIRTSELKNFFCETDQLQIHLTRFLSPSSKYDSGVRQWSARILTCLLSFSSSSSSKTARKNWDTTYQETLLVLNSHRWTSSENASSYVNLSLSLVHLALIE